MKIKIINKLFISLFLTVIALPLVFTNFHKDAVSMLDNRALAKYPFTSTEEGERFTVAVDNYFNDRIGFRKQFISINSMFDYYMFKKSPNERVILGNQGWLFYNSDAIHDGHTIDMYLGEYRYSTEELQQIAENLASASDYLESIKCEFILFIAPNKESVCSEYMPDDYKSAKRSEESATEQLISYLRKNTDIRIVWPYKDIINYVNNHPDKNAYFKTDTHWNHLGAYIGAKALLDELNVALPSPDEIDFSEKERRAGDLFNFLALDFLRMSETDYVPEGLAHSPQKSDVDNLEHWEYWNLGRDSRKLLVIRDSFSANMANIIGSEFNSVDFYYGPAFSPELIEKHKPDILVLQLVERYDDLLKNFSLD